MDIDPQKSILSLKRLVSELETYNNLSLWIQNATSVLKRIYPDRDIDLSSGLTWYFQGNSRPTNNRELTQLLNGYIKEIEELGHPRQHDKRIGQQININQTVNLNLILDVLKEELKGKEIKEIKDAYEKGETLEEKKGNVADKLKKFGSDVATNVLASIITNPNIISGL